MSVHNQLASYLRDSDNAIKAARASLTDASVLALKLDDAERVQVLRSIALAKTKLDEAAMWAGHAEGVMQR